MKFTLIFLLLATNSLYAATKESNKMMPMEMNAEQRVNMTMAHENMATCLKSDKAFDTCRAEMMKSCKGMMGNNNCDYNDMKGNKMMKHRK